MIQQHKPSLIWVLNEICNAGGWALYIETLSYFSCWMWPLKCSQVALVAQVSSFAWGSAGSRWLEVDLYSLLWQGEAQATNTSFPALYLMGFCKVPPEDAGCQQRLRWGEHHGDEWTLSLGLQPAIQLIPSRHNVQTSLCWDTRTWGQRSNRNWGETVLL